MNPDGIRIGTSERGGTFHAQGCALAAVLERRLGPVAAAESRSASTENARRLAAGEVELAFMASNWIGRARNGEPPFEQPVDLAMVAPMNAGPLFFVAPVASPLRTVADLRGRRVAVGLRSAGMVQHAHAILGALGMSFADITPIHLDFAAGALALVDGSVEAQLQCPIPNPVMTDLAQRLDLRVLSYGDDELRAVLSAVPFYRRTVMRKDAIRGLAEDIPQVAVVNVLVTHQRVAEATVRTVVEMIIGGFDELGAREALFAGMAELYEPLRSQGASALEFGGVPLHSGALRAYREAGLLV